MGNYRQHIGFAGALGVFYAWGAFVVYGIGWLYGSVAALLATLGGLLPDLDHPIGVQLKGFTGILGVLAAVAVWRHLAAADPVLPFEVHLWAVVLTYMLVRHGLRRVLSRLMVHRGISHSIPAAIVWACLAYLNYPSHHHRIRLMMALAVVLGVLSHLVLDEYCSVDLVGAKVNRAFGSALKLWSPTAEPTVAIYVLAAYLGWQVLRIWPGGPELIEGLIPGPATPPGAPPAG
ncbi:MAG TPA: metal-dependent hydrolase [Isosphaeraceae bacterium]|jgi:membrane-bound metal-dependent hydrolase YbcI (DUF457 family)